jgi:RNA polymerase sigma-70 factor (ECF subfamily)
MHLDGIEISGEASLAAAGAAMDADKKEQIQRAMTALQQLPPDQKEAIVLGIFQDLSYAEMEEITGTKAVTLRSRMFHGLRKLAAIMEQNGRKVDV